MDRNDFDGNEAEWEKAQDLLRNDCVHFAYEDTDSHAYTFKRYYSVADGRETYEASVELGKDDQEILWSYCSCPKGKRCEICEHQIAAMIDTDRQIRNEEKAYSHHTSEIDDAVDSLPVEKVRSLLKELCHSDPALKRQVLYHAKNMEPEEDRHKEEAENSGKFGWHSLSPQDTDPMPQMFTTPEERRRYWSLTSKNRYLEAFDLLAGRYEELLFHQEDPDFGYNDALEGNMLMDELADLWDSGGQEVQGAIRDWALEFEAEDRKYNRLTDFIGNAKGLMPEMVTSEAAFDIWWLRLQDLSEAKVPEALLRSVANEMIISCRFFLDTHERYWESLGSCFVTNVVIAHHLLLHYWQKGDDAHAAAIARSFLSSGAGSSADRDLFLREVIRSDQEEGDVEREKRDLEDLLLCSVIPEKEAVNRLSQLYGSGWKQKASTFYQTASGLFAMIAAEDWKALLDAVMTMTDTSFLDANMDPLKKYDADRTLHAYMQVFSNQLEEEAPTVKMYREIIDEMGRLKDLPGFRETASRTITRWKNRYPGRKALFRELKKAGCDV